MSTTRGIFDSFPDQPAPRQDSPFAVVAEPAPAGSPFSVAPRQDSPFAIVDDASENKPAEPGKPAKLPDRRKAESPFQMADPQEGFGFEAPAQAFGGAPFETPAAAPSPFSLAPSQTPAASPFSVETPKPAPAAAPAFGSWPQPAPPPTAQPAPATPPPLVEPQPAPAAAVQAPAPAPVAAPAPAQTPAPAPDFQSDSFSIRQLELRAIFGVDREMNTEEILQRSRALPGIRNIARVSQQDMTAVEALKNLLTNLGFGGGTLKLYSGSVPLDFIREGSVLLAVQTDGGYAPGVRETLMIVARELGRSA